MKSAAKLLLGQTETKVWYRGEIYADEGRVAVVDCDDKAVRAVVCGTDPYHVNLSFTRDGVGGNCTCPYFESHNLICKHLVAVALVWDEDRGVERPEPEVVEAATLPPSTNIRREVDSLIAAPRSADLQLLRVLPDITALGGRGRPHSDLPDMPSAAQDSNEPLTVAEFKRCRSEMRRWARRKAYDPYFCAGEMIAAFCAMVRVFERRLGVTPLAVAVDVLTEAERFHSTLVGELIDDSQGLRLFSEAHLAEICAILRARCGDDPEGKRLRELLDELDGERGVY